jgi:hypothetical protein
LLKTRILVRFVAQMQPLISSSKDEILNIKNQKEKYILVNVFDFSHRAEKTLKKLDIYLDCFFDFNNEIVNKYNIKLVPYKIKIPKTK